MEFVWTILQSVDIRTSLIFGIMFLTVYYYMFGRQRRDIPGPFALPIIGNCLTIVGQDTMTLFQKLQKQYGNVFRLYYGPYTRVVLSGKDNIYEAFVTQADAFSDRPNMMTYSSESQRRQLGLIWSNGRTWKVLRKLSLQAMRDFGLGKKSLEDRILEECTVVLDEIGKTAGQSFSIRDLYISAVANITHSIIFGHRRDYSDPIFVEAIKDIASIFNTGIDSLALTVIWPFLKIFKKNDNESIHENSVNKMRKYIMEHVEEHRVTFDKSNIRDFIDIYLDTEQNEKHDMILTKEQMLRTIIQLFNAGTDTTAASLSWSVLYMIQYPDVQEKCRQEIEEVVGHGRQVQLSDRPKLKYVDATLREIQRISNVAGTGLPHTANRDTMVGGYLIPKGAIITAFLKATHEETEHWDDPFEFNPSRFLDADNNIKKIPAFLPFSVGPRACPGEQLAKTVMFLMFCSTLQRFDLQKEHKDTVLSFEGVTVITTIPRPYKLRASPR